ncbi:MAG: hypothetical protein ABS96_32745 [Lysobacteraceae bacterium SCN 69-123]|nr:MAG: hypothetical protein ABS96_32745 [Xanthomonadaceae bacterium SCN 69-123]
MVSCIGSDMGKVAVATQLCVTNQQINSLVVDTEDDSLFVYYNLSMRKQELQDIAGGSAQPILNKTDFGLLTLELPPPPIQRAIVRVLAVLDDKIEINRRMNRTLETLAQKLFKSWFVDFDPVVAKSEGRKPFGLSDELAALFPSEFEDTELGLVPLGWRPAPLGDAIQLVRDLVDPQAAGLEEFDHYSIPAFDSGQRPVREMGSAIKSGKYLVPDDAILLSKLNPETPRVWWPTPDAHRRAIASTEFLVCRARTGVSRTWLYWQLRDADFLDEFATRVTGTSNSHQRVRPDDLLRLVRLDPGQALRHRFAELVEASTKRMVVNLAQSQKLAALRDLLLPRLLSGELRVPVAESAMTAAL